MVVRHGPANVGTSRIQPSDGHAYAVVMATLSEGGYVPIWPATHRYGFRPAEWPPSHRRLWRRKLCLVRGTKKPPIALATGGSVDSTLGAGAATQP
ncbi:hypothetical protein Afe04nite_28850 [Asanoa ferruginea]|nr:hypothetical protein Afe04nite_28850 [Asanoa ferruginea]